MSAKESETLFNLVRDRYSDRLSPEELDEVRKEVEKITETSKAIREVKLENWDEPLSIFKPFSKGE